MGFSTAYALATDPHMELETAVSIHFSSNCYPPIPQYMVGVSVEAVLAASAGDWYHVFELPEGVTKPDGLRTATVAEIIDNCRLDAFVFEDVEGDC